MIQRLHPAFKYTLCLLNRSVHNVTYQSFEKGQSFHYYISSLCKQKNFRNVLRAFDDLEKNEDCLLHPSTYAQLIVACASLRSLEYGRKIHKHIVKFKLEPDMILANHILNMYGKCGSTKDARMVFDSMRERNVVTWTAVIAGYAQKGPEIEAIKLYIQMQQSGFLPDQFTFGSVIKACSSLNDPGMGNQLHVNVLKSELGSGSVAQNALIAMYTKFCQIDKACKVFCGINEKDLVSWSSMISSFSKLGYELEALSCFREMMSQGMYFPNEFIFGSIISACGGLGKVDYGEQIHALCIKGGYEKNAFSGCSLTDMYAKCGFLCSAKTAFELIENPDIVSWNSLIAGFAYSGDVNGAMLIFSQMRRSNFTPDDITVRSLLCAFVDSFTLSHGKQVHSYIIKVGLDLDVPVCNTLLTMYANCSTYIDAYKLFIDNRENSDLVSWNAVITMCMHCQQVGEVFSLFRTMLVLHGSPDHITIANVMGACGKVSSLERADQVYCYSVKNGLDFEILVTNASIDMYLKCGSLARARGLFDMTRNWDVVSWSSLIVGHAQFGHGEEALNLFTKMSNLGVKPNEVTFVGVLTACSHVGLVEEGLKVFKSMEKEYGIIPNREHYSCVIDLLARADLIHEAEVFINQMGFEPDIVMLKSLLSACRRRGNIDVGKRVAENIMKIDPSNSTAHVLLSGLYASSGDWKDVAKMRGIMRAKGVKKVAGQSWIEVNDKVNSFSVEDGSHPDREKIYEMLVELWLQILDADYVPFCE